MERTPRVVKEEVVFRMQPGRYGRSGDFRALVNGVEVGYLQTTDNGDGFYAKNMESKPDGFVTVSGVHVREPYRRLGIAAHMYRYAEQQLGEQIYPALAQYDDAKGFWRWRNTQADYGGYYKNAAAQIKSATGNSGEFDTDNPDIRFSRKASSNTPRDTPPNVQPHIDRRTVCLHRKGWESPSHRQGYGRFWGRLFGSPAYLPGCIRRICDFYLYQKHYGHHRAMRGRADLDPQR